MAGEFASTHLLKSDSTDASDEIGWWENDRVNKEGLLLQQNLEPSLLEMMVGCQRVGESVVPHHDKGNAVRQRPLLVLSLLEEIHAALKETGVGRNDFNAGMIEERSVEQYKVGAVIRVAISVAKLGEHPFGGDDVELRGAGKFCRLQVTFLAGIQQREKIKCVGKDRRHFLGSPRR